MYCLRKDLGRLNSRYNPYDLRIVSSEKARTLESYYTVSAFTVTEVSCSIKYHEHVPKLNLPTLCYLHGQGDLGIRLRYYHRTL